MNTKLTMTLDHALQIYSVDSTEWWDGTGDTDQMLGVREWLEDRTESLSDAQWKLLRSADARILKLADQIKQPNTSSDAFMLLRVADIARLHHVTS